MTSWGTGGRLFTYVIMLDGQWRFTETGEEFAIGLLSKHTMHSDAALYIAFSGEFFVRRKEGHGQDVQEHENEDGSETNARPGNPGDYELIIDNDSGTYRPKKELLPILQKFLARPENLGKLGEVKAMDGFDEELKKMKDRQKEIKKKARAKCGKGEEKLVQVQRGSSISSSDARELGATSSISSSDVSEMLEEAERGNQEGEDMHEDGNGAKKDGSDEKKTAEGSNKESEPTQKDKEKEHQDGVAETSEKGK